MPFADARDGVGDVCAQRAPHGVLVLDFRVAHAHADFAVRVGEGGFDIFWEIDGELACGLRQWLVRRGESNGVPNGPLIWTEDVGASTLRVRASDRGSSMNCNDTSGGMLMGSLPIREARRIDVENCRCDSAGTRKPATSLVCAACRSSLRKLGRRPVQAMLLLPSRFRIR